MRLFASMLCLAILLPLTGCENGGRRFIFGPNTSPTPPTPTAVQSADELVDYLNANAGNLQSLRCVKIDGNFQGHGFNAKMMAMKPRNFFMTASAFGSTIVDLGSNDNEFWFWSSKAPEPYQFFCSYKDFESGKVPRFPFPFQPDWIMETLGMGPYGPASKYTVDYDAKTVKLVEKTRTPQDIAVRKVIVMSRFPEKPPTPQVKAYLLLDDATGKEICSAQIQAVDIIAVKDHRQSDVGVVVPRSVEFRVPSEKMTLKLTFSGTMVNVLNPVTDINLFQRHEMPGVQSVNLARDPIGGGGRSVNNNP